MSVHAHKLSTDWRILTFFVTGMLESVATAAGAGAVTSTSMAVASVESDPRRSVARDRIFFAIKSGSTATSGDVSG